jgi:ubiquinone/menaquinone biosynthesis C-methylase UbiE
VYAEARSAALGVDIGQNSWLTADELERFVSRLEIHATARLLDVGCGSGGPSLHVARLTECQVIGVERDNDAVAVGTRLAREQGLQERVSFVQADAGETLPFGDGSFDAILCVDAINHLPDRSRVLGDWARLLRPGGRVVFTDPSSQALSTAKRSRCGPRSATSCSCRAMRMSGSSPTPASPWSMSRI